MSPSTKQNLRKQAVPIKAATTERDPKAKPKRPLSAYNLFFQYEREALLRSKPSKAGQSHDTMHSTIHNNPSERRNRSKTVRPPPHGKIGFAELARMIGARWKGLDATRRKHFQGLAAVEKRRYVKECAEWKARMTLEAEKEEAEAKARAAAEQEQAEQQQQQQQEQQEYMQGENSDVVPPVPTPTEELPLDLDVLPPLPYPAAEQQQQQQQQQEEEEEAHEETPAPTQQDMYDMLNPACEISEGSSIENARPLAVQSTVGREDMPLNFTIGSSNQEDGSYYNNQNQGYNDQNQYDQQYQSSQQAFVPPTWNQYSNSAPQETAYTTTCTDQGQYHNRIHRQSQQQYQSASAAEYMYHTWGNTNFNVNEATLPTSSSSKPARAVSGGSPQHAYDPTSAGGAGPAPIPNGKFDAPVDVAAQPAPAFVDTDILDFLSRIVSD